MKKLAALFLALLITISAFGQNKATDGLQYSGRSGHHFIVFQDRMFIIGGNYGYLRQNMQFHNDVWTSQNGLSWERIAVNIVDPPRANFALAVFDDRMQTYYNRRAVIERSMEQALKREEFQIFLFNFWIG